MSDSRYDSASVAQDAAAFMSSRFGQHYLARLKKLKTKALDDAMNSKLKDSYRLHQSTRADVYDRELAYFATASSITSNPDLMTRLKKSVKQKLGKEDAQV